MDHQKLREVFLAACDLEPEQQQAFVHEACGGDDALLRAVQELLRNDLPDDRGFEPVAPTERVPDRIGPYRILELLGEGGMGRVYRAERERPRRTVALKVLRVAMASPDLRRRFEHEADVLARLQHPGIAQVFEFGADEQFGESVPYLAMELVEGATLVESADQRSLDVRARIELFCKVCEAVGHAHEAGVIHRDLKPGNILVHERQPKVFDFGISRMIDPERSLHTRTGQFVGTVGYMSPEQILAEPDAIGVASDVYSLGVVLYELLTGRPPLLLDGLALAVVAETVRDQDPPPLGQLDVGLRGDLEVIALKCLEKDPSRRYANAAELAADLQRHLRDEPILARPTTAFYQVRKFARRHRVAVIGAVAFVLALVAGIVMTTFFAVRASEERDDAVRSSYRATIAAVEGTIDRDPLRADSYLASVPELRRGWEWQRLQAMLQTEALWHGDVHVREGEGGLRAAVLSGRGVEVRDVWSGRVVQSIGLAPGSSRPMLSPSGRLLAVRSDAQRIVHVFDMDGERRCTVPFAVADPDGAEQLLWTRDERELFVLGGQRVVRYDLTDGSELCRFAIARPMATLSPDGQALLCTHRNDLSGIDLRSGEPLWTRDLATSHMQPVVSPDGAWFVVGDLRGIRLLGADLEGLGRSITGHRSMVTCAAFARDSGWLATSGELTRGIVRVIEPNAGRLQVARVGGAYDSLAFSVDHGLLAAGNRRGVTVMSTDRGAHRVLRGHERFLTEVAVSPDGTMLASGGWDGQVLLWDAVSGERLGQLRWEPASFFCGLGFSADGQHLFAQLPIGQQKCVQWDVVTGQVVAEREGVAAFVAKTEPGARWVPIDWHGSQACLRGRTVRFAPGRDGACRVLSLHGDGALICELPVDRMSSVALSQDETLLAIGNEAGRIDLYDCRDGFAAARLAGSMQSRGGQLHSLAFDPSASRLAAGTDQGVIDLWDVATCTQVAELTGHDGYVHAVRFTPDGSQLVSASGDATVRIWDTVPFHLRLREHHQTVAAQDQQRASVEELLRGAAPDAVASRIRRSSRTAEERRAALRVLMGHCHR